MSESGQNPLLVGICGKVGSGKTTAARYLVANYGFLSHAMADPLKSACGALFGLSTFQLEYFKEEKDPFWGVSPRYILQRFGTEIIRDQLAAKLPELGLTESLFITLARRLVHDTRKSVNIPLVFSDIRFGDEAEFITSEGGILIRLCRDEEEVKSSDVHSSERQDFHSDEMININNTKSLAELYREIDQIMKRFHLSPHSETFSKNLDPPLPWSN